MKINTKFLATEGIPEILTVGMIPFTMLALFCGWAKGSIELTLCTIVLLLCIWSVGYSEWLEVKGKISRLHFGIFGLSYLTVIALGGKLYAMTETASTHKLFILAIVMAPCIMIAVRYNNAIDKAEKLEEKDREAHIAAEGYEALWTVAILLLVYSFCFWAVYCWGDALSVFTGYPRLESWQAAMHSL